jgi:hypothetical protein
MITWVKNWKFTDYITLFTLISFLPFIFLSVEKNVIIQEYLITFV